MMPFQQMHHQDNEPALELAPIVAPYALNLLGNVGSIDHAGFGRRTMRPSSIVQAYKSSS
jgi:hypothetical protein